MCVLAIAVGRIEREEPGWPQMGTGQRVEFAAVDLGDVVVARIRHVDVDGIEEFLVIHA